MNEKNSSQIIGAVALLVLAGVFVYRLIKAKPNEDEISQAAVKVEEINSALTQSRGFAKLIAGKTMKVELPLNLGDQATRDNPFAKLE